mmetsp:Transcript_20069/g.43707  ORF Transcript_20069/g.43707 Transcript_20069/m.43707 type:complete len:345 (+) Transcript_20069:781-1815(+)
MFAGFLALLDALVAPPRLPIAAHLVEDQSASLALLHASLLHELFPTRLRLLLRDRLLARHAEDSLGWQIHGHAVLTARLAETEQFVDKHLRGVAAIGQEVGLGDGGRLRGDVVGRHVLQVVGQVVVARRRGGLQVACFLSLERRLLLRLFRGLLGVFAVAGLLRGGLHGHIGLFDCLLALLLIFLLILLFILLLIFLLTIFLLIIFLLVGGCLLFFYIHIHNNNFAGLLLLLILHHDDNVLLLLLLPLLLDLGIALLGFAVAAGCGCDCSCDCDCGSSAGNFLLARLRACCLLLRDHGLLGFGLDGGSSRYLDLSFGLFLRCRSRSWSCSWGWSCDSCDSFCWR